jgi:hypothetical protein
MALKSEVSQEVALKELNYGIGARALVALASGRTQSSAE